MSFRFSVRENLPKFQEVPLITGNSALIPPSSSPARAPLDGLGHNPAKSVQFR